VPSSRPTLAFGEYRLDSQSGQLYRGAAPVSLTPKAFALLQHLAASSGKLLTKEELLEALWPGVYVTDAVLKTAVREIRRALDDDSHTPRFIETAHRRGYRFIASVTPIELPAAAVAPRSPTVRYARSGNVNIAYQVVGSGSIDLVFVMGWVSHLEYFWNEPSFSGFLQRLAVNNRLIVFDKRGTGLSDPVPISELPTLEQRLDDVRAVMEAAGSERAVLMGVSEGGPLCSLFAATYPHRTEALVMIGSYARRLRDADYPWGPSRDEHQQFCQKIIDQWGGPVGLEERAPSRLNDAAFRDWWASYLRMGASPGAAVALTRMNAEIDIRDVLPSIRVPTLVLHRTGDRCLKVEEGRYLASRIPGARFVELPGDDHLPFVGDQDAMVAEIERFLAQTHARPEAERVLGSVLTVRWDERAWREVAAAVGPTFERELEWARGQRLAFDRDRFVASFDGPGRAVRCGAVLVKASTQSGIAARGGVHIGERHLAASSDPIVEISARLAEAAAPGEIYVSRTVVDLVPGSGIRFEERGRLLTPATPGELAVLAVMS
jgi:pimeloyl-ACP methyl ester carboxylesterase/DNA-binding winged helix-turn-helix (wHTH) protein